MIEKILRAFDGPLTRDLVRKPGSFGLGQVPERLLPDATTTLTCGYCSTGCGLKAHLKNGEAINLTPDPSYPVNLGMACPKGWEALAVLDSDDRAVTPMLRKSSAGKQAQLMPASWDEALTEMTLRFKAIMQEHGPESVAFLSTGQIPMEEMLVLGMLFKFGMGAVHCDANTRQCMATAHVAYKQSFGFDAPPFTYADFEQSDTLIFVGANPAIAHPILWERVMLNRKSPRILVVDPRRTETAQAATHHYAIAPKSDLTLFYGLAHILIREGWVDANYIEAHTEGFSEFSAHVLSYNPETVAQTTGISISDLFHFAQKIHEGKAVSFWWTMGVNQSHEAVRTAQALINLALMTGNIGRPGTGANSITGQANAMGSRLYSITTSLPGARDTTVETQRQEVADILGIDVARIPKINSLAYDQILEGVQQGRIKGLWVIATNPKHSWIGSGEFDDLIKKLDCLVVQDMYTSTDTARLADIVLPAAGWGEKDGTFINSERRIGLLKKVRRAPGQALADFHIFKLIAEYWGCADLLSAIHTPEDAFQLIKKFSAGRPCDITGIVDYAHLNSAGGIQWPYTEATARAAEGLPQAAATPTFPTEHRERRLFADGKFFTANERAYFLFETVRAPSELPDSKYPLILMTGRGTSAQWHTNTRTAKSAVLRKLYPAECYVEMHPKEAAKLGIHSDDWVVVHTRRGEIKARCCVTSALRIGQIFLPMHYEGVNRLTFAEFDPYSRQPSYKYCAARLEKLQ